MKRTVSVVIIMCCCLLSLGMFCTASWAAPKKEDTTLTSPAASGNPLSLELNEKGVKAIQDHKFDQAEEFFRKALATDPKNLTAAFNLAGALISNKKDRAAISLLEEYTAQYPSDPGLFTRLGDAHFGAKRLPQALESYQKAMALAPHYHGLPQKLGTIYGLMGKPQQAEEMFLKAVEDNPKDGQSLANLSAIFLGNGKVDKAISTAKRALQVKATSEVYVTLGTAYEMKKDFKNALISFQRARDLGDKRSELTKKIEGLNKVVS